ncbi:MAG: hypothetical protein WBV31_10900 [Terriglobales bacterium]
MAQLVIRNIENTVKARLQCRARRSGRSVEAEIRNISSNAAVEAPLPAGGLGSEIAGLYTKIGLESGIPELRGHRVDPRSH